MSLTKPCARASQPIPTRLVASGPCQEVVYEGKDVDVTKLPLCTNNPRDGGPYITAGHVIIRDPEYGNNLRDLPHDVGVEKRGDDPLYSRP